MATQIEEKLDTDQTAPGLTNENRTQKRPPPETSPASDLQNELKKFHREDSSDSTNSKMNHVGVGKSEVENGVNTGKTGVDGMDIAVRQKLYADLLSRSMANTMAATDSPLDIETFGVEDPADSLLL